MGWKKIVKRELMLSFQSFYPLLQDFYVQQLGCNESANGRWKPGPIRHEFNEETLRKTLLYDWN